MKSLVLAEKPSVAREIARVLNVRDAKKGYIEGNRYVVTWALGHLVELKMPEHYDPKYKTWRLEDLPIIPRKMELKVIRETSHQFKAIENLLKRNDIKEVIIATDAGREGELVARWILEKARCKKNGQTALDLLRYRPGDPGRVCPPASGKGIRKSVPLGRLPRRGRLAHRPQRVAGAHDQIQRPAVGGKGANPDLGHDHRKGKPNPTVRPGALLENPRGYRALFRLLGREGRRPDLFRGKGEGDFGENKGGDGDRRVRRKKGKDRTAAPPLRFERTAAGREQNLRLYRQKR